MGRPTHDNRSTIGPTIAAATIAAALLATGRTHRSTAQEFDGPPSSVRQELVNRWDLNGDGRPDIAVSDIGEHSMEILSYGGPDKLTRGLAFKVFEKKSFRDRDSLVEPRDMAVGDVDGDGRTDLILICHDRVLVYRQDPGTAPEKAEAENKTKSEGATGSAAGSSE